jgi:hypothetical protein
VTIGGATGLLTGDADAATTFDGSNDYVIVSSGTHNMANATFACWVQFASNPASSKHVAGLVNGIGSGTYTPNLYIDSSGRPHWNLFDGGTKDINGTALSTGAPHFLVGTCNSSNSILYVDGVQAATIGCAANFTSFTVPNIFVSGNTSALGFFAFTADEFALWNSALTSVQVAALYTAGTTAPAPSVTTNAATSIADVGATLNATINPNGASTNYSFEYGLDTSYGTTTTPASAGSGTSGVAESTGISGLTASTTYHFRAKATNSTGTTNGSDASFSTTAADPTNAPVKPSSIHFAGRGQ